MKCLTNIYLLVFLVGFTCQHRAAAEEGKTAATGLFDAIDGGRVDVQIIALSAKQANVLITNQSDKPLHLELPKTIAAVPVLGQFGQNQNFNQNQGGAGGGNQGIGGAFDMRNGQGQGNQQGFQNGQGFGRGFMRVAPGKVCKLKAKMVCLEHGKPDPKPKIAYRMIPLQTFIDDPIVTKVCEQLGTGQITQKVAQAVVWHQANKLSWAQLAELDQLKSMYRGNIKFFSENELNDAKGYHASATAKKHAESLISVTSASQRANVSAASARLSSGSQSERE